MLILSRREAESVCLGDNIVITIVGLGTDKVRVGVVAPTEVRILRTELETPTLPFTPPPAVAGASKTRKHDVAAVLRAMENRTLARTIEENDDTTRRVA